MDASLGKIWYTTICHVTVIIHINACQSPSWHSYRSHANDASVSWELYPPIFIDCKWMYPWARYDIPPSVMFMLPLISMLVSPRHDTPIAANLSADRMIIEDRLPVDGCIPGQDRIYHHLSCCCWHSYQCLSVPDMTLLSQPCQWCICQLRAVSSDIDWL